MAASRREVSGAPRAASTARARTGRSRHWTWLRGAALRAPRRCSAPWRVPLDALEQVLAHQAELDKRDRDTGRARRLTGSRWAGSAASGASIRSRPMSLLAELVDFQRFQRPRELMAYVGLVPERVLLGRQGTARGASPRPGTPMCAASWSRPPGTTATAPARPCPRPAERGSTLGRRQLRRGRRSSGCTGAIGIWSGTESAHRWQWSRVARELVGFLWAAMTRATGACGVGRGRIPRVEFMILRRRRRRLDAGTIGESSSRPMRR